jgi:hypothetical protein
VDRQFGNCLTRHGPIGIRRMGPPGLNQCVGACANSIAPVGAGIYRPPGPVRLISLGAKAEGFEVYEEMTDEVRPNSTSAPLAPWHPKGRHAWLR